MVRMLLSLHSNMMRSMTAARLAVVGVSSFTRASLTSRDRRPPQVAANEEICKEVATAGGVGLALRILTTGAQPTPERLAP